MRFGIAVPTLSSGDATVTNTEATLTPTETSIGKAECLELATETGNTSAGARVEAGERWMPLCRFSAGA